MEQPQHFIKIVGRKRYSVATATLIADNAYWDGHNFERSGRNTFLYCTRNGSYFVVTLTMWQGERDTLEPIGLTEALELFETGLSEHYVTYHEAFPQIEVTDA